ncbi:MAG: PhoH family protein [Bacteroidetes bacterium]|nr:MAG: PhoH family protein [Bacteroidota bacterium]TAG88088.1 MAG: PhoH family protein [Bacteroidota bacterium]
MVEKIIQLNGVPLVDFLGVDNINLKKVIDAFPKSKIIVRGEDVRIQGSTTEILRINEIINSLLLHYSKFGKITADNVDAYLNDGTEKALKEEEKINDSDVLVHGPGGLIVKPKTANQIEMVKASQKDDLVFAIGPAGTGKTFVAVALAVRALKDKIVKKIVITRPAVEAGENLGFLPGDLKEKIDPYLRPIYDALDDMIPAEKLKNYIDTRIIEIAPLAYMRGRTLNNAFVLLDEAQNTTPMQMKMFLTRLGPNSKMIITGDQTQIDLPHKQKSGLVETMKILTGISGISFVYLDGKDVVRHKLVRKILEAYEKEDTKQASKD